MTQILQITWTSMQKRDKKLGHILQGIYFQAPKNRIQFAMVEKKKLQRDFKARVGKLQCSTAQKYLKTEYWNGIVLSLVIGKKWPGVLNI